VPLDYAAEPAPGFANGPIYSPSQGVFYRPQLRPQSLARRYAGNLEPAILARSGAIVSKAQKLESFRLPQPPLPTLRRRKTAKLDQPGFIGM